MLAIVVAFGWCCPSGSSGLHDCMIACVRWLLPSFYFLLSYVLTVSHATCFIVVVQLLFCLVFFWLAVASSSCQV